MRNVPIQKQGGRAYRSNRQEVGDQLSTLDGKRIQSSLYGIESLQE